MGSREVVTVFLAHGGRVLLGRRSRRVRTFRGCWAAISGTIDGDPLEQALTEVREETGLGAGDLTLLARGEPLQVVDAAARRWRVHPFAFAVADPDRIRLNWEHTEARWVAPADLARYRTVPGLARALARVYGA